MIIRSEKRESRSMHRHRLCVATGVCLAVMLLLAVLLPVMRHSVLLLCNRVFDASEQVNTYVYSRFEIPADTSLWPALALFAMLLMMYLLHGVLSRSALPAFLAMILLTAAQAWLGLSLDPWLNVCCFGGLGVWVAAKAGGKRAAAGCGALILLTALLAGIMGPGCVPEVEYASEQVRDWLGTAYEQHISAPVPDREESMAVRHQSLRELQ